MNENEIFTSILCGIMGLIMIILCIKDWITNREDRSIGVVLAFGLFFIYAAFDISGLINLKI